MKKWNYIYLSFFFATIIAACTINIGGPQYPTPYIPISTEAIGELQQAVQTAVAGAVETGQITLTITEIQLTSLMASKLQARPDPFITNPQVFLRDGQIMIYGTAQKGYFLATASVLLTPSANAEGKLEIELTSADFGPFPIPDDIKSIVTSIVTEAYTGALGPIATGFRLESVSISNGTMILTGRIH